MTASAAGLSAPSSAAVKFGASFAVEGRGIYTGSMRNPPGTVLSSTTLTAPADSTAGQTCSAPTGHGSPQFAHRARRWGDRASDEGRGPTAPVRRAPFPPPVFLFALLVPSDSC